MNKLYYILRIKISLFLLFIFLKFKVYSFCAFIIWLNLKKLKKLSVNTHKKKPKKILVLSKSGGIEDLKETFINKKNYDLNFFWIPRKILKKIHKYCFQEIIINDYYTKIKNPEFIYRKKLFVDTLFRIFKYLDKFYKFDGIISFNIFYYSEKYLDEVFLKLNKKFIVIHKESTFTPIEERCASVVYEKFNDKSSASKISVYSEKQKNILIKSKIADKKQIVVNGCPRSDFSFKLRSLEPKKNIIVYYLIEKSRSNNLISKKFSTNWSILYNKTLNWLLEYAKNKPDITLILKGKTGIHNKLINKNNFSENCIFIDGGTGEKLLKNAKVVIAFNSTIVFESILANRNLIVPNFNKENIKKKKKIKKIDNSNNYANYK